MTQLIIPLVLMLLVGGYSFYMHGKMSKRMPEAFRMFFERTGYRYADIVNQPIENQITHGYTLMSNPGQGYQVHMVRDFYGVPVHSMQSRSVTKANGTTTISTTASWWAPLQAAPRIPLQVAERSLTGATKAIKEVFSNSKRVWHQQYPVQVATGDPDLDKRFLFFGTDEAAVRHVSQDPHFKELLLGCPEVDLTVHPDRVVYADPLQKNMNSGMGGMVGNMALGADMMKRMELTIPVHDHVAQLLARTSQLCQ